MANVVEMIRSALMPSGGAALSYHGRIALASPVRRTMYWGATSKNKSNTMMMKILEKLMLPGGHGSARSSINAVVIYRTDGKALVVDELGVNTK